MIRKDIKSFSKLDTHPAAEFVKTANQFHAEISLEKGGHRVNGKSIMGLMELANRNEDSITLIAEGQDAPRAMEVLGNLLEKECSK